MSIDVKLTVVGFFHEILNRPITISAAKPTVKDALDEFANSIPEVFGYTAVPSPFIKEGKIAGHRRQLVFSINYKGFKLDSILNPIVGSEERVWQFYVQDAKGVNRGNPNRYPYDEYDLANGDTVIWRLVTVFKSAAPKRIKMATESPRALANQGKPAEDLEKTSAY